ncbi:MAG: flavin reductase family protein [Paracoccus sp. (in: a-proteobacteria)]|uniref:flavin reductase family protein n=1 Tax=Paracoccus sp. TaxID=267 RepID=UPI0039E5BA8D
MDRVEPVSIVSAEDLRQAMSRLPTGVVVASSFDDDGPVGMTINSFTSVCFVPPRVLICLNRNSRGYAAIEKSGVYAINILGGSQEDIAIRFATPGLDQATRFRGIGLQTGITGSPLIEGASAWLDCCVTDIYQAGTHGVFFADVLGANHDTWDEMPLVYYRRGMQPLDMG